MVATDPTNGGRLSLPVSMQTYNSIFDWMSAQKTQEDDKHFPRAMQDIIFNRKGFSIEILFLIS